MDGEAPEPIEVELTSHDPQRVRGRWRREAMPGDPVEPPADLQAAPDPPDASRHHRTQLVTVAAVAAVIALALGWMLGRATSGGSDTVADGAGSGVTTTSVANPRATLPIVGEEIDDADFDEPAVGTPSEQERRDTGPVTTELTGPTVEPIAVDARLAGTPVRLVGVEPGGDLVEADLGAGTLTDFQVDRIVSDGRPLVVGTDWVVATSNSGIASSSSGTSRVIRSDGTESPIDLGGSWQILHVPETDRFWHISIPAVVVSREGDVSVDRQIATLVGLDGEPVGPAVELPVNAWPMLVDPASGGLVVANVSRNYVLTPDGVEYLGLGSIVAISPDLLVTYDCDETLVCSLFRTDRATGTVTIVPSDPDLDEPYQWSSTAGWGGSGADSVSPDGRWVAVIGDSWRDSVAGIVELDTGRFVELSRLSSPPAVVWSPDGRFAFALDEQVVIAYDTVTGDRFPVFADAVQWIQLGVRPDGSDDAPGAGAEGATLLSAVPEQPVEG